MTLLLKNQMFLNILLYGIKVMIRWLWVKGNILGITVFLIGGLSLEYTVIYMRCFINICWRLNIIGRRNYMCSRFRNMLVGTMRKGLLVFSLWFRDWAISSKPRMWYIVHWSLQGMSRLAYLSTSIDILVLYFDIIFLYYI